MKKTLLGLILLAVQSTFATSLTLSETLKDLKSSDSLIINFQEIYAGTESFFLNKSSEFRLSIQACFYDSLESYYSRSVLNCQEVLSSEIYSLQSNETINAQEKLTLTVSSLKSFLNENPNIGYINFSAKLVRKDILTKNIAEYHSIFAIINDNLNLKYRHVFYADNEQPNHYLIRNNRSILDGDPKKRAHVLVETSIESLPSDSSPERSLPQTSELKLKIEKL